MKSETVWDGEVLTITVTQKALVRPPDWAGAEVLERTEARLVAIDLGGVDFISSLFFEGCVALGRRLAAEGRRLVLLDVSPAQKRSLELIQGAAALRVIDGRDELRASLSSLMPAAGAGADDDGVTRAEKGMLWR